MKNNKKLVVLAGAAALGLVAATGVTSGFAWFAVNSQVTATSLTVQAKTNASYLLINTAASTTGGDTTKAAATATSDVVYPVAQAPAGGVTWDKGTPDNTADDVTVDQGHWYTAAVNDRNTATPNGNTVKYTNLAEIAMGNDDYFVHYDFYLYLQTGSEASITKTITVTAAFADTHNHDAAKAAITVDGTNYFVLGDTESHAFASQTLKVPSVEADYVHFQVELFIDGTATDVKSATTLSELVDSVTLTFAI